MRAALASRNAHKLHELQAALQGWELELLDVHDYPAEDGRTYADNARGKARFGRSSTPEPVWVLGEDSGIEVEALGGRPGIESARWAGGEHVTRLLAALDGEADRRARYVCELVAIGPGGEELSGRGELAGWIPHEAHGGEGFGFDPIFVPAGEQQTVAELGNAWKAENSHRARAAQALAESLPAGQ